MPDPAFRRKYRFDDEEPVFVRRQQRQSLPAEDLYDPVDGLPEGDRWSTWDLPAAGDRGPEPYPRWLVTEPGLGYRFQPSPRDTSARPERGHRCRAPRHELRALPECRYHIWVVG